MNVRLKYDLLFTAGVYHDSRLRMNNYNLRLWMITNSEDFADQNTSFERIKYFMYNQIDSGIFINTDHAEQCKKFATAGLNITAMPGDPTDQLVGIMLYHKLNAIMENRMIIVETELSSTYGENMTYLHSENETTWGIELPVWWNTADLIHSDMIAGSADNIVAMTTGTPWRELDLDWANSVDPNAVTGNVVFADFKSDHETK
jgi:hypothetical protein